MTRNIDCRQNMSHVKRKPFNVSNNVIHKLSCTATEDGKGLENWIYKVDRL